MWKTSVSVEKYNYFAEKKMNKKLLEFILIIKKGKLQIFDTLHFSNSKN